MEVNLTPDIRTISSLGLFYWLVCVEQVPTIHPVIPVINHYCTTIRGSIPVSASIKPGQAAAFLRRPVLAEWFACLALDPTFGFHDRLDGFHPPARPGTSREHNPGKIGIYSRIHFCHGQPGGTALKHYKQRLPHSLVPGCINHGEMVWHVDRVHRNPIPLDGFFGRCPGWFHKNFLAVLTCLFISHFNPVE